jgi:hypothetical protein
VNERVESWLGGGRRFPILVALLVVTGFALRMIQMGNPLFGDELSTLWIIRNHGFFESISVVSSNAEITPPLYFMLSWLTTQLGSAPELVRIPALIAGTLAIPMSALLGYRTVGRTAGLLAALIVAISPYMTYFSANGRAYSLMICFLLGAVLSMLAAARTGRARWWIAFAACAALAMYSHYMGGFVLAAALVWLLVFHPDDRKPALLATVGAAVAYVPWIPSMLADNDSPTKTVMEHLQGDSFEEKRAQVEQWLVGQPLIEPGAVPGRLAMVLFAAGLLLALIGTGLRLLRDRRPEVAGRPVLPGLALVAAMTLTVPIAQLILMFLGTDMFGARNLAPAWAGLPVLIGALLSLPSFSLALVATVLTLGSFAIGAVRMTDPDLASTGYGGAARFIEANAGPGDVVMDSSHFTPVPLTQLDTELPQNWPEYRVNQPLGDPPFLPVLAQVIPADKQIHDAFREAGQDGGKVFAVTQVPPLTAATADQLYSVEGAVNGIPRGWRLTETKTWDGYRRVTVNVFEKKPN